MKKIFFVSFSLLTFIACSHKVVTTTATTNPPPPAEKPKADANAMYASDIKSILESKCAPCHFPAQGGSKTPFDNFDAAGRNLDDMIRRVQLNPSERGYMPFMGKKPALTSDEIASLKAWKATLGK